MTAAKGKGPIFDLGLCRCCGNMKKCRVLNVEYDSLGQKEVYSDMVMDCFGLLLSHLDGPLSDRLICAMCVTRIRDALNFRRQVRKYEEAFLHMKIYDSKTEILVNSGDPHMVDALMVDAPKFTIEEKELKIEPMDELDMDDRSDAGEPPDDALDETSALKPESIVKVELEDVPPHQVPNEAELIEDLRMEDVPIDDSPMDNCSDHIEDDTVTTKKTPKLKVKKSPKLKKKLIKKTSRQSSRVHEGVAKKPQRRKPEESQDAGIELRIQPTIKKSDVETECKAYSNTVTIVENSFVCPFYTSYSDYYCIYCREMFTDPNLLREHASNHDPTTFKDNIADRKLLLIDIDRIDCRLCLTKIDDIDVLKKHLTSCHGKKFYDSTVDCLKFRLTANNLTCTECGSVFSFFHALKKHMAEHFGSCICNICGAHYFEDRMLILHQKSHQKIDESFSCKDCSKIFKSKHSRYLHETKMHKKEPAYPCCKCDEVLFSYSLRYRHMIDVHGDKRMFQCEHCDRVYDSRKSLREHNRRYHLKILKHQCVLCDKRFNFPSMLKEHMATHTGERNFRCEYCGKSYPRLRGLKVHMQSHITMKKSIVV